MALTFELTTGAIFRAFADEIKGHGGSVSESSDDRNRLLARAVLPRTGEVARRDQVQAGVAIRATVEEIDVHPYLFRLVCRNGQIFVEAAETRRIEVPAWASADAVLQDVRQAVEVCCGEEAFASAARQMRLARGESGVNAMITLMPLLGRIHNAPQMIQQIMEQYTRREEQSRFGLINAVTATARTVRDPETKWRLEAFGGELAALERPLPVKPRSAALHLAAV